MGKKLNSKERRELQAKELMRKRQERQNELKKQKIETIENDNNSNKSVNSENSSEKSNTRKSSAKAAGMKSFFVLDDKTGLMTSFGNGNKAILEKKIIEVKKVENIADNEAFSTIAREKTFGLNGTHKLKDGSSIKGSVDNPLTGRKESNRFKAIYEKEYFGKTFDDNIHIQIIYNILDLVKILAVHANNIVYSLDNIGRDNNADKKDFIGGGSWLEIDKLYDNQKNIQPKTFSDYINKPQLYYFGNTFYIVKKNEWDENILVARDEKEIYYILSMISQVRHFCVHYNTHDLFNLDSIMSDECKKVLDDLYAEGVKKVNFLKTASQNNLGIIFKLFQTTTDDEKISLTKEFYNFSILKAYKDSGYSVKKIREEIRNISKLFEADDYKPHAPKINLIMDFIIWKYYETRDAEKKNIANELRFCNDTSENIKKEIYHKEAERIYGNQELFTQISELKEIINYLKDIKEKSCFKLNEKTDLYKKLKEEISQIEIGTKATTFSKIVYLMTMFLDGKEINDLVTQLISKMDNIASLIDVLVKQTSDSLLNRTIGFTDRYSFFDSEDVLNYSDDGSWTSNVVEELKNINGVVRMTKSEHMHMGSFIDAVTILNRNKTKSDLETQAKCFYDEYIQQKEEKDKNKNAQYQKSYCHFIINNVIHSRKFNYIVRYVHPDKIRKCMNNDALVQFVLEGIPNEQIESYFNSIAKIQDRINGNETKRAQMIDSLTKLLVSSDFENDSFEDEFDNDDSNNKNRSRTLISLYLDVLYQIAKNLVYVNSRYMMAFHALDRDLLLWNEYGQGINISLNEKGEIEKGFVNLFAENGWINEHAQAYTKRNLNGYNKNLMYFFRNKVDHLNVIRDIDNLSEGLKISNNKSFSYFQLYHYMIQKEIQRSYDVSKCSSNDETVRFIELTKQYPTYNKDFVKAYCVQFAYNLPRFKNLAIDELFDKNDKREKVGKSVFKDKTIDKKEGEK